jgi:N-acetylglutamate synthase-like GNAT family acetyltransferase
MISPLAFFMKISGLSGNKADTRKTLEQIYGNFEKISLGYGSMSQNVNLEEQIHNLRIQSFDESVTTHNRSFKNNTTAIVFLVIELNGEQIVLGAADLHTFDRFGYLSLVCVKHKQIGLGKLLMDRVREAAKSLNLEEIYLHCESCNNGFYKKTLDAANCTAQIPEKIENISKGVDSTQKLMVAKLN